MGHIKNFLELSESLLKQKMQFDLKIERFSGDPNVASHLGTPKARINKEVIPRPAFISWEC